MCGRKPISSLGIDDITHPIGWDREIEHGLWLALNHVVSDVDSFNQAILFRLNPTAIERGLSCYYRAFCASLPLANFYGSSGDNV
jgi:hypothetical protein